MFLYLFCDNVYMVEQYYYLIQSIYAVFGILFFLLVTISIIIITKKIIKLEEKFEKILEKGLTSADAAHDLLITGEKILALTALKIFKKIFKNKKEDL
jgi:hypothetical protein